MDESELNKQLKNVKEYLGSYAADELKSVKFVFYPTFLIINLDERKMVGSHWISVAVYHNCVYICDSLGGITPTDNMSKSLINFLNLITRNKKLVMTKRLQPMYSDKCGYYCVVFVKEMSKTHCFCEFIKLFTFDLYQNDKIVDFLIKK